MNGSTEPTLNRDPGTASEIAELRKAVDLERAARMAAVRADGCGTAPSRHAGSSIISKCFVLSFMIMESSEKISHEAGNDEAWICICGNTPVSDGFDTCNEHGNHMEPVEGWEGLYVCDRCGRIIRQETLEVIGRKASVGMDR